MFFLPRWAVGPSALMLGATALWEEADESGR